MGERERKGGHAGTKRVREREEQGRRKGKIEEQKTQEKEIGKRIEREME